MEFGSIRDPNGINDHVRVDFEGVIGEPTSAESMHCVWKVTEKVFNGSMNYCYKGLTAVCGVPMAMCWGLKFACVSFNVIWCATPCIKAMNTCLKTWSGIYSTCVKCACQPCYEAVGTMFSNISIRNKA